MNDQQIEKEIVEKGKTAPRITPQHIEAVRKSKEALDLFTTGA